MKCPQSTLGKTGISLSRLVFGSMRLNEKNLSDRNWENLLHRSYELGITTLHSSDEYESFSRFATMVRKLQSDGLEFEHIVKLAVPHFGSESFDTQLFQSRIESYCRELGVERLDVVQWMWRADLKDEPRRLQGLASFAEVLQTAVEKARSQGIIGSLVCFPYTFGFAQAAIEYKWCDGLTMYLNPLEREMEPLLTSLTAKEKSAIAIRPLSAKKALDQKYSLRDCFEIALNSKNVTAAIVSWSSEQQLLSLIESIP